MAKVNIANAGRGDFRANPQNINRNGRPKGVSIKRELEQLLNNDNILTLKGTMVKSFGVEKDKNGNDVNWVKLDMPTQQALALKYIQIGMTGKSNSDSIKVIENLLNRFDGKDVQPIEISNKPAQYDLTRLTEAELEQFMKLADKCIVLED